MPSSPRALRIARHILLGLVLVVVFALLFGGIVMWAWNAAIPAVTGWPSITYGQAVAILVLGRILCGRFSGHHGRFHRRKGCSPARESAALYAAWWQDEGETAFQAYAARHLSEGPRD